MRTAVVEWELAIEHCIKEDTQSPTITGFATVRRAWIKMKYYTSTKAHASKYSMY